MKKKSQIRALRAADNNTGKMSKVIASKDTVSKRINATTLYPRNPDSPKQMAAMSTTVTMLYKYCLDLFCIFNEKTVILNQM